MNKLPLSLAARLLSLAIMGAPLLYVRAEQIKVPASAAPAPSASAPVSAPVAPPAVKTPVAVAAPPVKAPSAPPAPPVAGMPNAALRMIPPTLDCTWLSERGANLDIATLARPLRQDSRLIVFPYDKNAIYPIYTNYNRFTHFEFEQGESILGVYLNDETEWEKLVSATGSDLFIRPRQRAVTGSVTVITSRRRYEMDLQDVQGCALPRYQRVSWFISDGVYEDRDAIAKLQGRGNTVRGLEDPGESTTPPTGHVTRDLTPNTNAGAPIEVSAPFVVNLQKLNINYVIEGDAELSPEQVMDDGTRSWFKCRTTAARRPALFLVNPDGLAETVEYATQGSYFVAARIFPHGILLKDGKQEVRIRNKASSCVWFDTQCKSMPIKNVTGLN